VNRLILVGNGFDLAHGLKTSYKDFIDDFWKNQSNSYDELCEKNGEFQNSYYKIIYNLVYSHQMNEGCEYGKFSKLLYNKRCGFNFSNKLLGKISNEISLQNWVDIENEYYNELKKTKNINELNTNFREIKQLLIDYLNKIDKKIKTNEKIINNVNQEINVLDFSQEFLTNHIQNLLKKINELKTSSQISIFESYNKTIRDFINKIYYNNFNKDYVNEILKSILKQKSNEYFDFLEFKIKKTIFLNFNYTDILTPYQNNKIQQNSIHGELNNSENPIIFGFGDDVDKKYQEFEDLNDNRYLENFKSIAYLQTDNYKKLLEFIDSEEYQVFIFGHSCGISDRTMLNTIFEHDNCKSIKPFYHKREDGTDNYTEIVQNISRNFNDKKKYRDRVVNKTYCEPLT
jgi:hypothetical protein